MKVPIRAGRSGRKGSRAGQAPTATERPIYMSYAISSMRTNEGLRGPAGARLLATCRRAARGAHRHQPIVHLADTTKLEHQHGDGPAGHEDADDVVPHVAEVDLV